jgi:hypothetical protein
MELQKLIEHLKIKKKEAMKKGYFLHGIMEIDGIVVVDFKTKTFSEAQEDGWGFDSEESVNSIRDTMNNLLLLGYKYDDNPETDPGIRWWTDFHPVEPDFVPVEPEKVEFSPERKPGLAAEICRLFELTPPLPMPNQKNILKLLK